jgi:hypothetical protein
MALVEYREFKGNKVISLKRSEDDQYPFSFGRAKAKLIVDSIEEIKKFAAEWEERPEKKASEETEGTEY